MTRTLTKGRVFCAVLLAFPLCSCITVKPPDKPIEVDLDIAITQEVVVRLEEEVEGLIEQNPGAFPATPETTQ